MQLLIAIMSSRIYIYIYILFFNLRLGNTYFVYLFIYLLSVWQWGVSNWDTFTRTLGGKTTVKICFLYCQFNISPLVTIFLSPNSRSRNFICLLTWPPQVMINFSLEMLEEKHMISFGVILLIGKSDNNNNEVFIRK